MSPAPRTTISLPRARFAQIEAVARHRGLPNAAAVISAWIDRAIAEGEIQSEFPGIVVQARPQGGFFMSIRDTMLPTIPPEKARVLAAVLSAAAGETDPELSFSITPGKPVVMELPEHHLMIARAGRSVRFVAKPKAGGDGIMASVSLPFAANMADQIREAFTTH